MDWFDQLTIIINLGLTVLPEWLASLLRSIYSSVTSWAGSLRDGVTALFQAQNLNIEKFTEIYDDVLALIANIKVEVQRTKEFKYDPSWSTRVINVPIAIDQSKQLLEDVTHGLLDKLKEIFEPFHEFKLLKIGEEATEINPMDKPNKVVKIATVIGEINTLVGQVSVAIKDAQKIVDLFARVRETIEHLDVLFLQQGNPREPGHQKTQRRPR